VFATTYLIFESTIKALATTYLIFKLKEGKAEEATSNSLGSPS
jgi:hypothetical protein